MVVHRYQASDDPARALSTHFCKPDLLSQDPKGPLNRPENFELHAHKTYKLGRFAINSWMRCKSGVLMGDTAQRIVFVEQDLNTVAEGLQRETYGTGDIEEFFALTIPELDAIARAYFAS